jgi:protein O-mannosyl-transferase
VARENTKQLTKKQRREEQRSRSVQAAAQKSSPKTSASLLPPVKSLVSSRSAWICALLIAVNLFVFAQVRNHGFINYDDPQYVSENPHVAGGLTDANVSWALTAGYAYNWHPLTWLSHMTDIQLYGLKPGPHHLTNVLFHIANTILLFLLLYWMTQAIGPSAFVAALFAVHPAHVESVAWIAERKDVLSTFFWLLTTGAYVAYVRRSGIARYLLVALLLALGLMSKPMLVTLPFTLFLLDYWPLNRVTAGVRSAGPRLLWEKAPLIGLALASSIITFLVQRQGGAVAQLTRLPLQFRIENALLSYTAYMAELIWPSKLAPFYPYPRPSVLGVIAALVVLVSITAAVLRFADRHRYLPVGWFWYLGTLVPVIGVIQVGDQSRADRYTYIPYLGLFVMLSWGISELLTRLPQRRVVLPVAASVVIAVFAVGARLQAQHWKDDVTLWRYTLRVTKDNDLAHSNLGIAFWEQQKVSDAIAEFSAALRIRPTVASTHSNLGVAFAAEGNMAAAIREFQEAIRIKPGDASYHYNLGIMFQRQGNVTDAKSHFKEALNINPGYTDARRMLDGLR